MSTTEDTGSASSNAGAYPKQNPALLRPHIEAKHDLIPLHRPSDWKGDVPLGKAPRDFNWQRRDYSGQDARAWMSRGLNVGVRLNGEQLVVDVDPRNFNGKDNLAELARRFSIRLDDFPLVRSGGGGQHLYMTKPATLLTREKLDGLPGLEFKTVGRQLVAAGSVHPLTRQFYRAEDPFGDLAAPPPAPDNLLDALARDSRPQPSGTVQITCEQLRDLLAVLMPTNFRDYDAWLRLMMACHHATRGEGAEEFVAWSILDEKYAGDADKIREKWLTLSAERSQGVTARTLFKAVVDTGHGEMVAALDRASAAADFGGLPSLADLPDLKQMRDGRPAPSYTNCLKVMEHAGLGLAYDELARRPLLRAEELPWSIDIGRELNDDTLRTIRHYLIEAGDMEFSKENVTEACLTLARQAPFNPVVDYLDALQWDGTPRLDDWLIRFMGAPDTEYTRAVGRLVLVAAARRARQPGCKFDQVLILEGAQGTGKSSALKVLGGDWYSDAELGRLDSKDAPLVLQGVWIHELGELTAMNRSEAEELKAFVSRAEDRYRGPYERLPHSEPRRCVFVGTTNSSMYLFDQTGNRRFWPVATGSIDLDGLQRDRDQLWAEAAAAEASGEKIELAPSLWPAAATEQGARLAEDPWKETLREWLDGEMVHHTPNGPVPCQYRTRVLTRHLFFFLELDPVRQTQHAAKRLKEVMLSLGWIYKRGLRFEGEGCGAGYLRDASQATADDPLS